MPNPLAELRERLWGLELQAPVAAQPYVHECVEAADETLAEHPEVGEARGELQPDEWGMVAATCECGNQWREGPCFQAWTCCHKCGALYRIGSLASRKEANS